MYNTRFEPFGEQLPDSAALRREEPRWRGRLLTAGVGLFWGLVGVIVVARAVYFDPDIAEAFLVAVAQGVRSVVNL